MTDRNAKRERWQDASSSVEPGKIDEGARRIGLTFIRPIVRLLFRPDIQGIENFPSKGPFLAVANHSGLGNAEIAALAVFILEEGERVGPIAPMVHPLSLNAWPQGAWMRKLGAIPSTYEAASSALSSGVSVLVFPGGDHEAMRPIWQANKVDFNGRQGFLKIAQSSGVPVVPIGISGSHYTAPVLWRSDLILPRLLILPWLQGLKRYPLTLSGAIGVGLIWAWHPFGSHLLSILLSWLWLILPFSTLPWVPWKIRARIGKAIAAEDLFDSEQGSSLDRAYGDVQSRIQALVLQR